MFSFDIGSFVVRNYLILIPIMSIIFAMSVFGYIAYLHTSSGEAMNYDKLSRKYPPNSIEAIRYRSISSAIIQGKRNYAYHIKGNPILTH